MKNTLIIIGTIALLAVAILFHVSADDSNQKECERFAQSKGCTIVSKERHWTTFGTPYYWKDKNVCIWEVKLSNGETWFMRPSFWSKNDWQKN